MSHETHSVVSPRALRLAAVAGAVMVARPVSAQLASAIDLSSFSSHSTANDWRSQLAISPFMRFDHPRLAVDGRWTAIGGDGFIGRLQRPVRAQRDVDTHRAADGVTD